MNDHDSTDRRRPPPPVPLSLEETGLTDGLVADLLLKTLHVHGDRIGAELARHVALPFGVIQSVLQHLKDRLLVEVTAGDVIGPVSYRYTLSERGRQRAHELMKSCSYVGPAPVTLEAYAARVRQQGVDRTRCTRERLAQAFDGLVIGAELLDQLGPAICSGRSLFVYGPSGNGKTCIARALGRFLNTQGGDIDVPYALLAESSIITVYDDSVHEAVAPSRPEQPDSPAGVGLCRPADPDEDRDRRWKRVRRPVIVTGGELTLNMLELQYNAAANVYQAPLHVKANGGVFLIDDFGRQIVSPKDLLNRWILPLEERVDFLTLHTGRKICVPFEQLIIFSTNMDPASLVDDAFLRRMRHKIRIDSPTPESFAEIFALVCRQKRIDCPPWVVGYLFDRHYSRDHRPPRCSDPRDLIEVVEAVSAYRRRPMALDRDLVEEACQRFFGEL